MSPEQPDPASVRAQHARVVAALGAKLPQAAAHLDAARDDIWPSPHAAISCKWTIRSDRVQNIRHECLQMNAVYHVAFDALDASASENANSEQQDAWREVVGQRCLLSYELLVDTSASW